MVLRRLTWATTSCLLLCAPLLQAQSGIVAKQLSGPPSEFASMAAPDPAAAAVLSKTALLPIELVARGAGSGARIELPVESGALNFVVFAGGDRSWQVSLQGPNGQRHAASELARQMRGSELGINGTTFAGDAYTVDALEAGNWTLDIDATAASVRQGFVLVEGDPALELSSYLAARNQRVGESIGVVALLTAQGHDDAVLLGAGAGRIDQASLRVTAPNGRIATHAMHDDGRHNDGAAADGYYGVAFVAELPGNYQAQVIVHGSNRKGDAVLRTAEHVIPVVEDTLDLGAGAAVTAKQARGDRLSIELPVTRSKAGQHYRAYAEVWGRDARGAELPVAWVGGMVTPANGRMPLGFDQRWVALAGAQAPFELRNLRIEDPDVYVSVAEAGRLALTLPPLDAKLRGASISIDERMRMGPRPAASAAKGVGTRLLLVHGYCSGGVWPTSHFSNASTFLDANKNRSNDQFARLIQSFGSTWNSFGTVAHSQGGMASLHLYNYYWSGLDYATGARLIQSVGTPYRGTNLAGVLAALGGIFGVGCGSQNDLTYSGAQAWLAGISSSSRAKVNYYTTAFRTTNWWTNDYCNFASDLVLSDPEDGTTEQVNGQLSGGVNRGHTTGQCHTAGMRDPAQYTDSSRNATMNANAAR